MASAKVTLSNIAKKANVSVATVSRVLNHEAIVSDELRETVEKTAKELDYTYKPKKNSTPKRRIGVLVGDILNEAYPQLLKGVLEVAQNHNVEIILYDYIRDKKQEEQCIKSMLENRVSGIIALPSGEKVNRHYEKMIAEHFPLVLLISSKEQLERNDVFIVTKDSCEGAYTGTKYLLDLGHRDILILGVPGDSDVFASRLAGYKQAFESVGIPIREELVLNCIDTFEEAYRIILDRCNKLDFTAVFAVTNDLTLGAWRALKDKGYRVPDDCSIVGYGSQGAARYLSLTSLAEPMKEIGKNAIYAVLELLRGSKTIPRMIILRDSLIIGDSCKKI